MRYLVALIGSLLYASASLTAQDWTAVALLLKKSAVEITHDDPNRGCTGFVINKEKRHVLSAGHCGPAPQANIYVDGTPGGVIYKTGDSKGDLMILSVPSLDPSKEQLTLADKDPVVQEVVLSGGYGFGTWQARRANVSNPDGEWDGLVGQFVSIDAGYIGGQSGGPVVNAKGEVVSIVQLGNASIGLGRGAEYIKDKVGRFFAKETAKP